MNFADNTGHIFSLDEFDEFPYGYEYNENPYIFWIDSPITNRLSVNNYYMRTIYLLLDCYMSDTQMNKLFEYQNGDFSHLALDDNENIEITPENILKKEFYDIEISVDSGIYSLVSTKTIQDSFNKGNSVFTKIDLDSSQDIKKKLTNEDLYCVIVNETTKKNVPERSDENKIVEITSKHILCPIYVIGKATDEGTWTTNILIHVKDNNNEVERWCPITVGGEWVMENEILMINGQNMGISLPVDIIRSIYQSPYYNDVLNEQLWNEKIKEYLLNYMGIKGELGNFNSVLNSLKWFGYNKLIDISILLQTDNQFKIQYVKDFFDISTDILESFDNFRNSALLSLVIKMNTETGNEYDYDFSNDFFGENTPELEDLMNKMVPVTVGKNEPSYYWKSYYNFSFIELGLKLSALKYYYDKYFLPIHMSINSASLQHKVYANDIKFINKSTNQLNEAPIFLGYKDEVTFPNTNIRYFTKQIHFVDDNYNEFEYITDNDDWYYINDSCVNIPIKFNNKLNSDGNEEDTFFNCVLILEKINLTDNKGHNNKFPDSTVIYESHFSFMQKANDKNLNYHDFVIYPKMITDFLLKRDTNQLYKDKLTSIYYWVNSEFLIRLLVNNRWYTYRFTIKLPDLHINLGTLNYKYWEDENNFSSKFRQLKALSDDSLVFNSFMYEPDLVEINNINFFKEFIQYLKLSEVKYISKNELIDNTIMYYLVLNDQRIAVDYETVKQHKTLYIPWKYLNETNIYAFKYDNLTVFLEENAENPNILTVLDIVDEYVLATEDSFINTDEYLTLIYDDNKDKYYAIVNNKRKYIDNMYELLYNSLTNLLNKYSEEKNIVDDDKYKNQVHIFDIYTRKRFINNKLWRLHNDIDVRCDNIRFIHKNYKDNTIYIQGPLSTLLDDKEDNEIRINDNTFNTHDDYTKYSVFWNDRLEDYANLDPVGYVYYIATADNGNILDEYAEEALTTKFNYKLIDELYFTYNEFINNTNTIEIPNTKYVINNLLDGMTVNIPDLIHGTEYSEVVYTAEFVVYEGNNIYSTYPLNDLNYDDFKEHYINNYEEDTAYKVKITFYYKEYYTIQNIELEYNGEVFTKYKEINGHNTNEIDYYYGYINEELVKLTPYYDIIEYKDRLLSEEDYDPDIENKVLKYQPARHWYNIDTYEFNIKAKDVIDQNWVDSNELTQYSSEEWENRLSKIYDEDLSYKNYLVTDITSYIKQSKSNNFILDWDAYITIYDENNNVVENNIEWEGIKLSLYIVNDEYKYDENNKWYTYVNGCEKNKTFKLKLNDNEKGIVIIEIVNYPNIEGKYFRATFTPRVCEAYDEYVKLEYNDFIEEDNYIEFNIDNKTYRYGNNSNQNVINLYNEFFEKLNYEFTTKNNITYKYDIIQSKINISKTVDYDQYLMHDDKYWYLVYISPYTIDRIHNVSDLYIKNKIINFDGTEIENINNFDINNIDETLPLNIISDGEFNENYDRKYQLRLTSSNKEFLPNRYWFKSANGVNHFYSDDLIAAKLENNNRLPINISNNFKWIISPYSIGLTDKTISKSNAEMIIFDAPKNDKKYLKGYYNAVVNYSVSGYTTQICKKDTMFRIN